ncbi:hypothetical protein [Acetobacter tropicalis]|nr:hypothetical protein [Acetobacter tropicalis]
MRTKLVQITRLRKWHRLGGMVNTLHGRSAGRGAAMAEWPHWGPFLCGEHPALLTGGG